ncbi:MAG: DUF1365 domain-containing protein [Proteobacteria bacterium]|nr:DUF1365 domain-containing protein [Pseudomonadota bacterium]
MNSCLYVGTLRHRRLAPRPHAFQYCLFMAYLDLAELDEVFRGRWLWSAHRPALAWFKRADYLGDAALPLDEAVREKVWRETGTRPRGPIRLLTHLRMFGHCFNPVSFYYCFDARGERVETVVAEITNTPWKERHAYVLPARGADMRFRFGKSFHVSPFMPMAQQYDWRFGAPGPRLAVHMENHDERGKVFDATLALERREISTVSLASALSRHPFLTLQVMGAIHWQALWLWAKRVPVHIHP